MPGFVRKGVRVSKLQLGGDELVVLGYSLGGEDGPLARLTTAEREVLAALLAGPSRGDVAAARGRAAATVARQVASIYDKVGVGSLAELVALLTSPAADEDGDG